MDQQRIIMMFPDMDTEELYTLQSLMKGMTEEQERNFLSIYQGKRKDRQLMVILCIIGFFGIAGVHRFFIGDIVLGIIYLLTGGLCLIGTIVDLININSLTLRYNIQQANESANLVRMMSQGY